MNFQVMLIVLKRAIVLLSRMIVVSKSDEFNIENESIRMKKTK